MSTFNSQVYLKKYIEVQSRVTTIGPSGQALIKTCKSPMLLSEEIVSGFVQGKDEPEAVSLAQDELEKRYARASGYNGHEHVKVKKVEEQPTS